MSIALGTLAILVLARLWALGLKRWTGAGERTYRSRSPLGRIAARRQVAAMVGAAMAPAIIGAGWQGWDGLGEAGGAIRVVAIVVTALMAWVYAAHERNFWLDRSHAVDRCVLVALAAACWMHPAGLGPFAVALTVAVRQFEHPSCCYSTETPLRLPLDALAVLVAGCALACVGVSALSVCAALLIVQATHYFAAGVAKVQAGPGPTWWVRKNHLANLFVAARQYGWRLGISDARAARVARLMRRVNPMLTGLTLAVELGAIVTFSHPGTAVALGVGYILLHLGILLTSGINFYKWAAVDAALVAMVVMLGDARGEMFGLAAFGLSIPALGAAWWLFKPVRLGWTDTRLTNFFRFEAEGESGRVYHLGCGWFAPYDVVFAQSRFFYLRRRPHLVGTFGCNTRRDEAGRTLAQDIDATGGDAGALEALRHSAGLRRWDPARSRQLEDVIRARLAHPPARRPRVLRWLNAPKHISLQTSEPYRGEEPIRRIIIRAIETYTDENDVGRVVLDEVVHEIDVGAREGQVFTPRERSAA